MLKSWNGRVCPGGMKTKLQKWKTFLIYLSIYNILNKTWSTHIIKLNKKQQQQNWGQQQGQRIFCCMLPHCSCTSIFSYQHLYIIWVNANIFICSSSSSSNSSGNRGLFIIIVAKAKKVYNNEFIIVFPLKALTRYVCHTLRKQGSFFHCVVMKLW